MKAKINVQFNKIDGNEVNKALLKKVPMLKFSTSKTCSILCRQIERYFKDNKIDVRADFELR